MKLEHHEEEIISHDDEYKDVYVINEEEVDCAVVPQSNRDIRPMERL